MEIDETNESSPENGNDYNENSKKRKQHTKNKLTKPKELARRKLLVLLAMHLQNFQRVILMSRHRFHQRMRRRQALMRSFYIQMLMETETRFLELLPRPSDVRQETANSADEENSDESASMKPGYFEYADYNYTDQEWLDTFRMQRSTFRWLCAQVRDILQPVGVHAPQRNLISIEKRVALSLYALASGDDYRTIARLFQVSRASVCKFVHSFAEVFLRKFGPRLLCMPRSEAEYAEIREAFYQASNMPGAVVGVLGLCELHVNTAAANITSYANQDGQPTLILQAVIDDRLLFRQVRLQTQKATLFLETPNAITTLRPQRINGRKLPSFLVTDSNSFYPLRSWLMKPYADPLAPHEYDFNEAVDNLLFFKQQAFTRLFARWHVLQRKSELEPRTMERIATACCALHNLLEEHEEEYLEKWSNRMDTSILHTTPSNTVAQELESEVDSASEMRDFLARTISSTEM